MNVWPFSFLAIVLIYIFFCTNHASLEIVAGYHHNCVYEPGQTGMKCWGWNIKGQLGYEDKNNRGDDAGEMSANLPIVALGPNFIVNTTSLGGYHSCAASQEHAVKCWGYGFRYQTGHATNNDSGDDAGEMGVNLAFVEFRAGFVPLRVAAGYDHSCVLSTDALLVCFGYNGNGQCGTGTSDNPVIGPPSSIAVVDLGSNFTPIDISAFYVHVCALSQQQTIKCFGRNYYGQLGYGDTTNRGETRQSMGDGLPVLSLGSNFIPKAVATGGYHTCALSTLKTVKCFGDNIYGECGQVTPGGTTARIGDEANEMDDWLPVIVFPDGFVPMQMALGSWHTCILSESAQVVCFGRNEYGQLGLGHTDSPTSPTLVDLGTDFIPRKITAGSFHTCAVSTVDTVKCWGRNNYGQLGLGHANNMGDQANEVGDDLPIVDVCFGCTATPMTAPPTSPTPTTAASPTTAVPTTAAPTSPAPTTAAPITTTTANPTTTATPTTAVLTTTATPTASPTTAVPTATTTTVPATTEVAIAIEYRVTIDVRSVSCADILVTVVNVIDAELPPQVTVEEVQCSDDDDDDDISTAVLLIAVAPDVQLDSGDIESTLREAMVEEYGGDVANVDVEEEEEETPHSSRPDNFVAIVAGVAGGAVLCFVCVCALIYCGCRRRRRTQVQPPPPPQPQLRWARIRHVPEPGAHQLVPVDAAQTIEMVAQPGAVAVAPLLSVANKKQPKVRAEQKDDQGESDSEQLYGGGAPTAMGAMQAYGEDDDEEEGDELFAVMKPPATNKRVSKTTAKKSTPFPPDNKERKQFTTPFETRFGSNPNRRNNQKTTTMTPNDATTR